MLRQCVEVCPEEVWIAGEHPRNFWRIAYHAVFYAHLYGQQQEADFQPWVKARPTASDLWGPQDILEPYTRQEVLDYIDLVDAQVDSAVDGLDLDSADSGFPWYPSFPKLDHQILNIRHIQGHVGQLSELLMAKGIDTNWVAKVPR